MSYVLLYIVAATIALLAGMNLTTAILAGFASTCLLFFSDIKDFIQEWKRRNWK